MKICLKAKKQECFKFSCPHSIGHEPRIDCIIKCCDMLGKDVRCIVE